MSELEPVQVAANWTRDAARYDATVRPFTAKFARDAVEVAGVDDSMRVLDVAAGTGAATLAAAATGAQVLATDFSPGMLKVLERHVADAGLDNVETAVMNGQALTVEDASFDRAFSVFGLMMFPDREAGFRELLRALKPGGRATVAVWFGAERLEFMHLLMSALFEAVPEFPKPEQPPAWLSISTAEGLRAEMLEAGFGRVNVFSVRHLWRLESPEWFFDRLDGLAPGMDPIFRALDDAQTSAFRNAVCTRLRERLGEGPFAIAGDANLAVGVKT